MILQGRCLCGMTNVYGAGRKRGESLLRRGLVFLRRRCMRFTDKDASVCVGEKTPGRTPMRADRTGPPLSFNACRAVTLREERDSVKFFANPLKLLSEYVIFRVHLRRGTGKNAACGQIGKKFRKT